MEHEKMTIKELNRRIKRYTRFVYITRVLSLIIYTICGVVITLYFSTYFRLTNDHIILTFIFVLITACIISGFETVMDQFYKEIDLMRLAVENKKEGSVIDDGKRYDI